MGWDHDWGAGHVSARHLLLQSQFAPSPWMQYILHRRCGIRNLQLLESSTDAVSEQQAKGNGLEVYSRRAVCHEFVAALCKCICCSSCSRAVHSEVPLTGDEEVSFAQLLIASITFAEAQRLWKVKARCTHPSKYRNFGKRCYLLWFRHTMVQTLLIFLALL